MSGSQNPQRHAAALSADTDPEKSRDWLENLSWALSFNYRADLAGKDTSTLRRVIRDLSSGSEDRAVALIMSPVMQRWVARTVSCPLVVNGHMYSSEEEIRQSPLSFFCAKLVHNILIEAPSKPAGSHDLFAVRWFCGEHTDFTDYGPTLSDYDAQPPVRHFADLLLTLFLPDFVSSSGNADSEMLKAMLSNMIGQLIFQILQRPLVPRLDHQAKIKHDPDLSTLCSLFTMLVRSLPQFSMLFIVIDGISYYEDEDRREECMEVLLPITELARDGPGGTNDGCLVKLLVTAPLKSHHAHTLFADSETLDLPEYIEPDDGYTESLWNTTIGGMIRDL